MAAVDPQRKSQSANCSPQSDHRIADLVACDSGWFWPRSGVTIRLTLVFAEHGDRIQERGELNGVGFRHLRHCNPTSFRLLPSTP